MSGKVSFHALIEALSSALIEAQDSIDQHQIAHLREYFDDDNRPRSVSIRMPSLHPDAEEGDEDLYRAPLLALVTPNNLRIRDAEISFDADLGELGEAAEAPFPMDAADGLPAAWSRTRAPAPHIGLDTARGGGKGNVRVVLRVEGTEPTEGAARLINQLAQSQGVYRTIKPE